MSDVGSFQGRSRQRLKLNQDYTLHNFPLFSAVKYFLFANFKIFPTFIKTSKIKCENLLTRAPVNRINYNVEHFIFIIFANIVQLSHKNKNQQNIVSEKYIDKNETFGSSFD